MATAAYSCLQSRWRDKDLGIGIKILLETCVFTVLYIIIMCASAETWTSRKMYSVGCWRLSLRGDVTNRNVILEVKWQNHVTKWWSKKRGWTAMGIICKKKTPAVQPYLHDGTRRNAQKILTRAEEAGTTRACSMSVACCCELIPCMEHTVYYHH